MKIYQFEQRQSLSMSQEEAWTFFANPANLLRLMPHWMPMQSAITRKKPVSTVYPGFLEVYDVRLFGLLPSTWISEITHVEAPHYFVDEQKRGPFAFWHHTHRIVPNTEQGGVWVEDTVYYAAPFGVLGRLAHFLFLRRLTSALFEYRRTRLEAIFNPAFSQMPLP